MHERFVRPMNLGSLNSFYMRGPLGAPRVDAQEAARLEALAEQNDQRFRGGCALFKEHIERAQLSAPVYDSWFENNVWLENGDLRWRRVGQENNVAIERYTRFLASVPHKVGIWMDGEGNFTDLRFGHWGVHSLHIGSSIFAHAQAVAFLMPHEGDYIPMEAWFADTSMPVRNVIRAWFRRYVRPQGWYLDLDKEFGISPFLTGVLKSNEHQRQNALRANTAHFHALAAPRLHLPEERYRALPGNEQPDPKTISEKRPTGAISYLRDDEGNKRELKPVYGPVWMKKEEEDRIRLRMEHLQRHCDITMRLGVMMYAKKLERMGMALAETRDVLRPIMDAADVTWRDEPPQVRDDIKNYISYRVGVPFKTGMWFDATLSTVLGMRVGLWGVHALHLGHPLGEADSVAYLMPHRGTIIPMRAQIFHPHARGPMRMWLKKYDAAQRHYDGLWNEMGVKEFLSAQRDKHPGIFKLTHISDLAHLQEISTTRLGNGREAYTASFQNLGSSQTFIYGERGIWMFGVGEGKTNIGFEGEYYGPGVHVVEGGGELRLNGRRKYLSASGGGASDIGTAWANMPWDYPY